MGCDDNDDRDGRDPVLAVRCRAGCRASAMGYTCPGLRPEVRVSPAGNGHAYADRDNDQQRDREPDQHPAHG